MRERGGSQECEAAASSRLSRAEFERRYASAYRPLWCIAAGVLGTPSDAEDVVQEAAMVALGKLEAFEPGTDFSAWMARIVRFVAQNHRRKSSVRKGVALEHAPEPSGADDEPAEDALAEIRRDGSLKTDQTLFDDVLMHALSSLSENARICLLMRTVLGMSYREIARVSGMPEGTVMSHVHRARCTLRSALDEGGAQNKGGAP